MKTLLKYIGIAFGLFLALTFILYGFVESPNATQAQIDKEQAREQAKIDYQKRKLEEEIAYEKAADWEYLHCQLNDDNGGYFYREGGSLETDDIYIKMNMNGFEEPKYSKNAEAESRFEARTINVSEGPSWNPGYGIELVEFKEGIVTRWPTRYDFPIRVQSLDDIEDSDGKNYGRFSSCSSLPDAIEGIVKVVGQCTNYGRFNIDRETFQVKSNFENLGTCKFVSKKEYDEPFKKWTEYKIEQKRLREEGSERAYQERLDNRKF